MVGEGRLATRGFLAPDSRPGPCVRSSGAAKRVQTKASCRVRLGRGRTAQSQGPGAGLPWAGADSGRERSRRRVLGRAALGRAARGAWDAVGAGAAGPALGVLPGATWRVSPPAGAAGTAAHPAVTAL